MKYINRKYKASRPRLDEHVFMPRGWYKTRNGRAYQRRQKAIRRHRRQEIVLACVGLVAFAMTLFWITAMFYGVWVCETVPNHYTC